MSTVRIQVRRGTATQWTSVNPILAAGEMGVESDTNLFKFGNGSSTWTALAYANNSDVAIGEISQDAVNAALTMGAGLTKTYNDGANTITINVDSAVIATKSYVDSAISTSAAGVKNTADSTYALASDRGEPGGYASLDSNTKIPTSQIDTTIIAERGYVNTQATAAITSAQTYTNTAINNLVNGAPAALDTLAELSAALGNNASYAATITSALALKSPLLSPTFTGNVVLPSTTTIGSVDATEISYLDGVTSPVQSQLNSNVYEIGLKAPIASPTFTGNVTLPESTSIGEVSNIELGYVNGVTSGIQTQLDAKAPLASPTFTGNVTLPSSTTIGSVSNLEMGYLDGATSNLQIQIDAKAPLANPTFTGSVTLPATTSIGLVDSTEMGYLNGVTSGIQVQLDTKAPLANAVFTGTFEAPVGTITGAMLANGTVTSAKIADGTIATIDLADSAVTSAKIADGTIVTGDLADSAVTSAKIADGTIVDADINASAGIAKTKIAGTAVVQSDLATGVATFLTTPTSANLAAALTDETGSGSAVFATSPTLVTPNIGVATATSINGTTIPTSATLVKTSDTGTVTSTMIADGTIIDADINASAAIAQSKISGLSSSFALKADLDSPTFTGTVAGITKSMVGLANVDNTADTAKPVSTAQQTALDLKAPLASPALTGTPTAPTAAAADNSTKVATTAYADRAASNAAAALVASAPAALDTLNELATALGNDASFSTTITNALALKAPLASPTFTGTVSGITKSMVGLGNVDNTADTAKPISTATQTALDLKLASATAASTYAPLASPTFTGTNTVANITVSGTTNLSANGVQLSDGTQTKVGVPSITTIGTSISSATTLAGLTLRDQLIPITGTYAVTIPTNATVAYPVGTSIDFWQSAGTGGNFVAASGVTLQYTPGLTLRTTYSSATITKVATDTWLVYGDLKA